MARSVKSTPIAGFTTARSEKQDKRKANRAFRRKVKVRARQQECEGYPLVREVSNVHMFDKDGKQFLLQPEPEWLRK